MEVMERVQQTVFTVQESIISILYIFHTYRFLNSGYATHTRKVVRLLVLVQAGVIALDGGLTAFDYKNMFTLKCTIHPFVYALKLKLEFIVLNQLLALVRHGLRKPSLGAGLFTDSDDSSVGKDIAHPKLVPNATLTEAERVKLASSFITKSPVAVVGMSSEEFNLKDIIGRPDGDEISKTKSAVSDLERQYLGRSTAVE
jgi:hypothetical protein